MPPGSKKHGGSAEPDALPAGGRFKLNADERIHATGCGCLPALHPALSLVSAAARHDQPASELSVLVPGRQFFGLGGVCQTGHESACLWLVIEQPSGILVTHFPSLII